MHIYNKLNINLQNRIDLYLIQTNKILNKSINDELKIYIFKKNINDISCCIC